MCQPCVTRVTLEKGCKRPVHRRCVSVSTYFSRKHLLITFFVNFLNFNFPSFMQQADFSFCLMGIPLRLFNILRNSKLSRNSSMTVASEHRPAATSTSPTHYTGLRLTRERHAKAICSYSIFLKTSHYDSPPGVSTRAALPQTPTPRTRPTKS